MGFELRPPYYLSFAKAAVSFGGYFAIAFGTITHLAELRDQNLPPATELFGVAAVSALFGLGMAVRYRFVRRKHDLSSWDEL